MEEKFQKNAALTIATIKQTLGVTLEYDESSIAWLDGYIERQRTHLGATSRQQLVSVLGAFLGECIRKQFGGEWAETRYGWGICFDENNCVFPLNKVQKQFDHGEEESILSFYKTIPFIFRTNGL